MRSRLAIVSLLAIGTILMGAGTGLAVSGISGSGDAGEAQYPTTTTTPTTTPTTTTPVDPAGTGATGVAGATKKSPPSVDQNAQQLEATTDPGDSLPFTGLAAIPVIAIGVGLLGGGLALRRRNS